MGGKAVLAASLVALLAGCGKDPALSKPLKKEVQQSVQSEKYASIEYLASGAPGQVNGFRLLFSPQQREYLSHFTPVSYEVPDMKMIFPLPVENLDFSSAKTTFPKPEVVDGKKLIILGYDHNQKKVLCEFQLRYKR